MFAIAALASSWPLDSWFLALLALGAAGSSLGPSTLWPRPVARADIATLAGLVGLVLFASLSVVAGLRGETGGLVGAALDYPALVAVPSGTLVLWIGRRFVRR